MFVIAPGRGCTPVVPALRQSGGARGGGPDAHLVGDAAHRARPRGRTAGPLVSIEVRAVHRSGGPLLHGTRLLNGPSGSGDALGVGTPQGLPTGGIARLGLDWARRSAVRRGGDQLSVSEEVRVRLRGGWHVRCQSPLTRCLETVRACIAQRGSAALREVPRGAGTAAASPPTAERRLLADLSRFRGSRGYGSGRAVQRRLELEGRGGDGRLPPSFGGNRDSSPGLDRERGPDHD